MALPALNAASKPSANPGLGSVANTNTASAPTNDNAFNEQATANQLAREKAYSRGQNIQNNASVIPFSSSANAGPQTDSTDEDENFDSDSESEEEQNSALIQSQQIAQRQQQMSAAQTQITLQQQQQAATAMAAQKQARQKSLQQEDQQLDKESTELIRDLEKFQSSGSKKYLAISRPNITFVIDSLINNIKKQGSHLSYRKKIIFLKSALTAIGLFLASLKSFRFFSAFIDAFATWIRWITLTIETIIIPIIIFLLGFFIVPFIALIFFIGKVPALKGKITTQIIDMIKKVEHQQNIWRDQLKKLEQIVARQDRKKANQREGQQLQKQA